MLVDFYLHREVASVIKCYGELEEVVDKLLSIVEQGDIDMQTLPPAPSPNGATRYQINVTNEYYISLCNIYPKNSSKISIRRLLYWFVEEEMADELGIKPVKKYVDDTKLKFVKCVNEALRYMERSSKYAQSNKIDDVKHIVKLMNDIKEN